MTSYLMVKNFSQLQHYRDRSPVWIKLYNAVMDDEAFLALPDAARGHLMLIWLLASRRDNKIPNDARAVARAIQATSRVDLERLIAAGFLLPYQPASTLLAGPERKASPEGEEEREERREEASSSSPAVDETDVTDDERQFFVELGSPLFTASAQRFLAGKPTTARVAWVGRFRGAMTRPPHPTVAELHDALEDLMTRPAEDWTPTLFRVYVGRIRSDATREAERTAEREAQRAARADAGSASRQAGGDDAGSMFAKIRELVQVGPIVPGQPRRKFIRRADVEALGGRVLDAYDRIGGADRFLDPDEKVGFVLRDFTREYGTLAGASP